MKINLSLVLTFIFFVAGFNNVSAVNTPQYQSATEAVEALENLDETSMTKKELKVKEKLTKKINKISAEEATNDLHKGLLLALIGLAIAIVGGIIGSGIVGSIGGVVVIVGLVIWLIDVLG